MRRWFHAILLSPCAISAPALLAADEPNERNPPPIRAADGLFDQGKPKTLGLTTVKGRHTVLFRATKKGYKFCHHPNLGAFRGRLYAMWSNGLVHEDDNGQRVLYSHTSDGVKWSKPVVLATDPDGDGPLACVAAGFLAAGKTLVAYYTAIVAKKPVHAKNTLFCITSRDGINWSKPKPLVKGFFIESPRTIPGGRLLLNGQWANREPRLMYSDSGDGITGWKDGKLPKSIAFPFPEPSWFRRKNGTIVMLFRTRSKKANARIYAAASTDRGRTWNKPAKTNFPDATARICAGNLPDGTAYIINNPSHTPSAVYRFIGRRNPLTIALSRDGETFDRAFIVRGKETRQRFPGTHKLSGWQYPAAFVWKDQLYVAYSINKEDLGVTRIALKELSVR